MKKIKKVLNLAITSALACYVAFAPAVYAEKKAAAPATQPAEPAAAEEENAGFDGFWMQHTVNGKETPEQEIAPDFMQLVESLRKDVMEYAKTKPSTIETEIALMLPEKDQKEIGELPSLNITTNIDDKGAGKSNFTIPAYNKELPADPENGKRTIQLDGLTGDVTFDEKFQSWNGDAAIGNILLKDDKGFKIAVDKIALGGTLDADMLPTRIKSNIPLIDMMVEGSAMLLSGFNLNVDTNLAANGVEISKGGVTLDKFTLNSKEANFEIAGFEFTGDGQAEGDKVTFMVNTKLDKVTSPDLIPNQPLDLTYLGKLELRNIDAESVKMLQKTFRDMQKQQIATGQPMSEEMVGMAMMGVMMQSLPKLWEKSPEIALTALSMKMPEGTFEGKATISVDGKKPFSMEKPDAVTNALLANADFQISKSLLQKILETQMIASMGEAAAKPEMQKELQKQIDAQINSFIQEKMLVANGDNFTVNITVKDGKMSINGGAPQPLPF